MRLEEQEQILNKASDKAVNQVIKERKTKRRNLTLGILVTAIFKYK